MNRVFAADFVRPKSLGREVTINRVDAISKTFGLLTAIASASLVVASTPAFADNARYIADAGLSGPNQSYPSYSDYVENGTGAFVQSYPTVPGTGIFAPVGAVSASASSTNNGTLQVFTDVYQTGWRAYAEAYLTYTFEISSLSGASATVVPLHIIAGGGDMANDLLNVLSGASIDVGQDGNSNHVRAGVAGYGYEHPVGFSVDEWVNFLPDVPITVSLAASSKQYNGVAGVADTAYVDPFFELDPAYASQFELTGLPAGMTSTPSAVPEPASWLLMIVGFGMIGHMLRRRRSFADISNAAANISGL